MSLSTRRRDFTRNSTGRQIMKRRHLFIYALTILSVGALLLPASGGDIRQERVPLRVLIVGGGPDLQNNQVAIESNVRYVNKLLPGNTPRTTLFADGNVDHATVLFADDQKQPASEGEAVLSLLMNGRESTSDSSDHYRKPNLGSKLDGASKTTEIEKAFGQIVADGNTPPKSLLLYFTGHGSNNPRDMDNNDYDLWGRKENLSVRALSRQIDRLPGDMPVTIVMVQCFSGSFANLIFEGGNPKSGLLKRDIAGFYASVKERVAAGCTSAVNEADYHDFTSYFFAALTGRDRVGRRVTGADYNRDGKVGMNEAYCYTLLHDESIDVPVCTSDIFLRKYVDAKDAELFRTPYSSVLSWADRAQRAALEGLSTKLRRSGENRLMTGYQDMQTRGPEYGRWRASYGQAQTRFREAQNTGKTDLLRRWPQLRRADSGDYKAARTEAIAQLTREVTAGKWKELLDANEKLDSVNSEGEANEVATSQVIRFVRLGKSVILAHRLNESDDAELKLRFAQLLKSESKPFLPTTDDLTRN